MLYTSRTLNQRQQGYATVEMEGLAIKWRLEHLRYLLGCDQKQGIYPCNQQGRTAQIAAMIVLSLLTVAAAPYT